MPGKTTKKTKKSQDSFRPGTEERGIFSLVLGITAELLNGKKIKLDIDSGGDPDFTLDPSEIQSYVTEKIKDQVSFENFMRIIPTEIEALLKASIFSDKTKGVKANIPPTIIKDVGIEELLWRLEETNKVLSISETFKREAIFKKTSKGLLLKDVKWETKLKVFDDEFGKLDNIEYATLSILYSQPITEGYSAKLGIESLSIQLPVGIEPKQVTLELQKKDVKKLIDNLQKILETF